MAEPDQGFLGVPGEPENAERRIRYAIGSLERVAQELTRISTIVFNIAADPQIDRLADRIQDITPAISDAIDLLGKIDIHELWPEWQPDSDDPATLHP